MCVMEVEEKGKRVEGRDVWKRNGLCFGQEGYLCG